MQHGKKLIKNIGEYQNLYRDDRTGIAWVEDGSTGCSHTCHSNIDATGSVRGIKKLGCWKKSARTVRSHGFIYNIDTMLVSDEYDKIAAEYCSCIGCTERRENTSA